MKRRPTPNWEGRHPDDHHLDGSIVRLGSDTHPISDELLVALAERVAVIEALAEGERLKRYVTRAALADIAEQAAYCRWLLAEAFLEGAA
jgi:hypothetical protein